GGSPPRVPVAGGVPGTQFCRKTRRHLVEIEPRLLAVRLDENIFFPNPRAIERAILQALRDYPDPRDLLLILSAVNHIDSTGLDMLCELSQGLRDKGIAVHLAEVKGPVMDRLSDTDWIEELVS